MYVNKMKKKDTQEHWIVIDFLSIIYMEMHICLSFGSFQEKAQVAMDAADGDLAMAVEILSTQQHI